MINSLGLTNFHYAYDDCHPHEYTSPHHRLPSPSSPSPRLDHWASSKPNATLSSSTMRSAASNSPVSSHSHSSPDDLGLLEHAYSPARAGPSKQYPSPSLTGGRGTLDRQGGALDDRVREVSPSPTNSSSGLSAKKERVAVPARAKRESRQTTIQEHLRTVKPGSPSPSSSSVKSASSISLASSIALQSKTKTKKTGRSSRSSTAALLVEEVRGIEDQIPFVVQGTAAVGGSTSPSSKEIGEQKKELMLRLVSAGLAPHPNVFDHIFGIISNSDSGDANVTLHNFLCTLAVESLKPNFFREQSNAAPTTPTTSTAIKRAVVFKSPPTSSESTATHLDSPLQTPQRRRSLRSTPGASQFNTNDADVATPTTCYTPNGIASFSSPSILPISSPTALAPSPTIHPATPSPRRVTRLQAFSSQGPPRTSTLVPAEVKGLGRVALGRDVLFKALGEETAQEAMRKAKEKEMSLLMFGNVFTASEGLAAVEPFSAVKKKGKKTKGREKHLVSDLDEQSILIAGGEKLRPVKSWLEAPDHGSEGDDGHATDEAWSRAPESWDVELDEFSKAHAGERLERELTYSDAGMEDQEDDERESNSVVRVGGKNIKILLRSKRNRLEEDLHQESEGEDGEDEDEDEPSPAKSVTPTKFKIQRFTPNKKGKGRADVTTEEIVSCVCERGDEGEPMVQCDDCRVWLHVDCLDLPPAKTLPKEWSCFRCTGGPSPDGPSPTKRSRTAPLPPSTPTPLARREPILVETAFSPRPKGNFYRNSAPDMALAPSPQVSPSRRLVPRTPIITQVITPPLGSSRADADYSPRSPLYSRAARTRFVSGPSDDASHWDGGAMFGLGAEDPLVASAWEEERVGTWNDLTMTPSRAVANLAWGELALATPTTFSRRSRKHSLMGDMTPSQDFLSALNQPLPPNPNHDYPTSSAFFSPLGPKSSTTRLRKPSIPATTRFDVNPFSSPRFAGERGLPLRTGSEKMATGQGDDDAGGLGIAFEGGAVAS